MEVIKKEDCFTCELLSCECLQPNQCDMKKDSNETINSLIQAHEPTLEKMLNTLEGFGVNLEGINEDNALQFKYNPKDEFHDFMKRQKTGQVIKKMTGFEVVFRIA